MIYYIIWYSIHGLGCPPSWVSAWAGVAWRGWRGSRRRRRPSACRRGCWRRSGRAGPWWACRWGGSSGWGFRWRSWRTRPGCRWRRLSRATCRSRPWGFRRCRWRRRARSWPWCRPRWGCWATPPARWPVRAQAPRGCWGPAWMPGSWPTESTYKGEWVRPYICFWSLAALFFSAWLSCILTVILPTSLPSMMNRRLLRANAIGIDSS